MGTVINEIQVVSIEWMNAAIEKMLTVDYLFIRQSRGIYIMDPTKIIHLKL